MHMQNTAGKASQLSFRAIGMERAGAGAPESVWTQAYQWFQKRPVGAPISAPGFPAEWPAAPHGPADSRQAWLVQLAGHCASAIEQCLFYARDRRIGTKPISDYQLVQQKISALATMEQILILCLDNLADPALPQSERDTAGGEILRVAHDLSDLVVDYLGGIGFASYQTQPICLAIQVLVNSEPAGEGADD